MHSETHNGLHFGRERSWLFIAYAMDATALDNHMNSFL